MGEEPKKRKHRRWALTGMYFFFLTAGTLAFVFPSQAILTALQAGLTYLWASFLFLGSLLSFVARLRGRVGGELIGIPLLSASNVIFALALWGFAENSAGYAFGCIFFGLGIGILDRWTYVRRLVKAVRRAELEDGDGEH
jgi:hypothetical protein